jgi:hypothetical protein
MGPDSYGWRAGRLSEPRRTNRKTSGLPALTNTWSLATHLQGLAQDPHRQRPHPLRRHPHNTLARHSLDMPRCNESWMTLTSEAATWNSGKASRQGGSVGLQAAHLWTSPASTSRNQRSSRTTASMTSASTSPLSRRPERNKLQVFAAPARSSKHTPSSPKSPSRTRSTQARVTCDLKLIFLGRSGL